MLYSPPYSSTRNSVSLGGLVVRYVLYVLIILVRHSHRSTHFQVGSTIIALNGLISKALLGSEVLIYLCLHRSARTNRKPDHILPETLPFSWFPGLRWCFDGDLLIHHILLWTSVSLHLPS